MQRLHTVLLITLLVVLAIVGGTWIYYLVAQRANTALWIENMQQEAQRKKLEREWQCAVNRKLEIELEGMKCGAH